MVFANLKEQPERRSLFLFEIEFFESSLLLTEGSIVDGIGTALYGNIGFKDGLPDKNNFHSYRMIPHNETPRSIDVHFVQNELDPTGLGEPAYPPVFGALANALYKATGKRFYEQPFISQLNSNSRA